MGEIKKIISQVIQERNLATWHFAADRRYYRDLDNKTMESMIDEIIDRMKKSIIVHYQIEKPKKFNIHKQNKICQNQN